jgi:NitT/TauT family transport system substrate-binding protein
MKMNKLLAAAVSVVSLIGLAMTSASAQQKPDNLKPVTLRLDYAVGGEHSGFYAALEQGFYREAGLDVTIGTGQGSNVTAQLVGSGRDTFGIVGAATVMSSVANKVPIKIIATLFPHTLTGLLVPKGTAVPDAKWMAGKRIAVVTASFTYNELKAVLAQNKMKEDDLNKVQTSGSLTPPLVTKQADGAIVMKYNDGILAEQQGFPTDFISFTKFGVDNPALTIVTNTETLKKDPEMVRAFLAASKRGWEFARSNPDAAYKDFAKYNPTFANPYNAAKLAVVIPAVFPADRERWGLNDPAALKATAEQLKNLGILTAVPSQEDLFTNAFVP